MSATTYNRRDRQKLFLAAALASAVALGTIIFTSGHGIVNPIAIASKGCRVISKSMTAGDIDAILSGSTLHLDNPDGGYCFNPPAVTSSK